MCTPEFLTKSDTYKCIILIGMAGAGKSTVAKALATHIDWALADTDHIIEAKYGTILQNITDATTKDEFLDIEATCIKETFLSKTIVATGGSVVYRPEAMEHLANLGTIVHIKVGLDVVLKRISMNPNRGLAIAEGQTVEDLFYEREALYTKYAQYVLEADGLDPTQCAQTILENVPLKSLLISKA